MLFKLSLKVAPKDLELFTGYLSLLAPQGWQEDLDQVHIFSPNKEELTAILDKLNLLAPHVIQDTCLTAQAAEDWFHTWQKNFQPVICGQHFVILPPWLAHKAPTYAPRHVIFIEPKDAFGTGQHETTALCLSIIGDLFAQNIISTKTTFLDLGTGTGILGLACCHLGMHGIGLDTDPTAIVNAQNNALFNHYSSQFKLQVGSLDLVQSKRFPLIMANILAEPLIQLSDSLVHALDTGGTLLLSGLLNSQAAAVAEAYTACGLPEPTQQSMGEWTALYWHAPQPANAQMP